MGLGEHTSAGSLSAVFADLARTPTTNDELREAIETAPRVQLSPGERFGDLELRAVEELVSVAFSISRDPGRIPILIGLLLLGAGLILYLAKRLTKVD